MIRDIAGRQNHSVKLARKLQKKKYRRERGLLVGEGMDLLLAALAGRCRHPRDVLVRRELVQELPSALRERAAASVGAADIASSDAETSSTHLNIGVCDQETLDYASSLGGAADVIFTVRRNRRGT